LHTVLDTSGHLGHRCDDGYLDVVNLVLLDIKSGDPETFSRATGRELEPTLRFAGRLAAMAKPAGSASCSCLA
jgi:pyruvate formate lyase activating enzyme